MRATRIGVVVNGVPVRKQGHYGSGYGYGYGEYGGYVTYGYGHDDSTENGRTDKRKSLLTKQVAE